MLPLLFGANDDEGCLAGANPTIEKYFHDCIYDTRDLIGFYFGLCSISCWFVAQLPQLITNHRRQSAEALSPFFLAQWLLGDTCNLLGALLKGDQPETVILTAQYFICMDVVLLVQYLYYTAVSRRLERTYVLAAEARRHHRHHHGHHHHHHHHSTRNTTRHDQPHDSNSTDRPESLISINNTSGEVVAAAAAVVLEEAGEEGASSRHEIENTTGFNSGNGTKRVLAAATTTLSAVSFISQNSFTTASTNFLPNIAIKEWQQSAGSVLGYISCVLYLASRISQILKNSSRQSAEGLASSMFLCAVAANLFYGTSVLMRSRTKKEILSSLPWVLGSLGTVALDGIILMQTVFFAKEERKNSPSGTGGGVAAINSSGDIEQPLLLEETAAE